MKPVIGGEYELVVVSMSGQHVIVLAVDEATSTAWCRLVGDPGWPVTFAWTEIKRCEATYRSLEALQTPN